MILFVIWLMAAVAIEGCVEIIVSSEFFIWLRAFFSKINPGFLGKLFTCGYCMSVWVAAAAAYFIPGSLINDPIVDLILRWLVLHRMSNLVHELLSRYFKRLPLVLVFNLVKNPGFQEENKVYEVDKNA